MEIFFIVLSISTQVYCQQKLFPDINDLFQTFNEDPFNVTDWRKLGTVRNISIDIENLDIDKFKSKILNNTTNDTRRYIEWSGAAWQWRFATKMEVKIKTIDIMLQIIYMARHKLKKLESEKFFNPKDTSYRISFLYRRMRRIWKRLTDIYYTMMKKREEYKKPFNFLDPFLILHHKAAKKHVDFLYLWWVQVKLHEKYCKLHNMPDILPPEH